MRGGGPSHLLLERFELRLDGALDSFPLGLVLEIAKLAVVEIGLGRRRGRHPGNRRAILRPDRLIFPFDERELVPNHFHLAPEQIDAFPMLGGKLAGDPDRFPICDGFGKLSATFRIGELLLLTGELPFGLRERVPALARGNLELDQGLSKPGLAIRVPSEQSLQPGPELFETHRPMLSRLGTFGNRNERLGKGADAMIRARVFLLGLGLPGLVSCSGRTSNYACGIAAMAGLSLLLEQFNRPGSALAEPPASLPDALPVRLALGPALQSVVGRGDSGIVVGVEGAIPPTHQIGFGVLVQEPGGIVRGVILYEGSAVDGAPRLGTVNVAGKNVPLIGIRLDVGQYQNAACPIFADSVADG